METFASLKTKQNKKSVYVRGGGRLELYCHWHIYQNYFLFQQGKDVVEIVSNNVISFNWNYKPESWSE